MNTLFFTNALLPHGWAKNVRLDIALADTNFAYACNSFNHKAVAAGVDINFIAPAHLGDTLTAVGSARHQGGRSGIYDIEVTNQDGRVVAVFRGRSTRIKGHFFDESEPT